MTVNKDINKPLTLLMGATTLSITLFSLVTLSMKGLIAAIRITKM
jgi:hypothetical protein